jgi:glycosyltransferase involved in cell wall biosynthesis
MTKVSIIITNYNYGSLLGRCIRSCLDQSLAKSDYEIILVDDGSTDESVSVAEGYSEYIKIFPIKHHGVAYASNYGIRKAIYPFVIRVDADDYINSNTLLFMSEVLKWNHEVGFVYCDHLVVDNDEKTVERVYLNTLDKLFRHGAGVMFRKAYLEALGLYDMKLKNAEDFDLLSRYLKNFDGYYLKLPLYRYYKHSGSLSSDASTRKAWEAKARRKQRSGRGGR